MLSHDFTSMDADCVEYIEAAQSPLRRLTGSCTLSFGRTTFAGKEGFFTKLKKLVIKKKKKKKAVEKAETLVIHPYAKLDHANEILDNLAPELAGRPHREECKPLPKVAFRRALIRECLVKNKVLWVCIAIIVARWILNIFVISRMVSATFMLDLEDGGPVLEISVLDIYYNLMQFVLIGAIVVGLITIVLKALTARRYAGKSGYVWNDDYLLLFDAGTPTHQTVIPRSKIQSGVSEVSWGQRKSSVATLQANTFTGSQSVVASLVDVTAEDTNAYLDWLKPRN
jgi:putative membrane protein